MLQNSYCCDSCNVENSNLIDIRKIMQNSMCNIYVTIESIFDFFT